MAESQFGPGVIGEEAFAARRKQEVVLANKFGPGVLSIEPISPKEGPRATPVLSPGQQARQDAVEARVADELEKVKEAAREKRPMPVTVEQLKATLATHPELFDSLFMDELDRPDGPRLGGLRIFQWHEEKQPEPREKVLELLDSHIRAIEAERRPPGPPTRPVSTTMSDFGGT